MKRPHSENLSRREFIEVAAVAGVGLLARPLRAAETANALPPITKAIPPTGGKLPAICPRTHAFKQDARQDHRPRIKPMNEVGGTVIDTSDDYGDSEALIGEALASSGFRDRMFIATKISGGGGADIFQRSLERLGTQRVELLQVHNLDGVDKLVPAMREWKK